MISIISTFIHANNCGILIVLLIDECYGWTVLVDNKKKFKAVHQTIRMAL